MKSWLEQWAGGERLAEARRVLDETGRVRLSSVYGSAQSLLVAALAGQAAGPVLAVVQGPEEAFDLQNDLTTLTEWGGPLPCTFSAWEALPGEGVSPSSAILGERLQVLGGLADGSLREGRVICAPIGALMQPVPAPHAMKKAGVFIRRGESRSVTDLVQLLSDAGLERSALVELPGTFSQRGGILDVYAWGADQPIRIDFFGSEVEAIHTFDPDTQRSDDELDAARIPLAGRDQLFKGTEALEHTLYDHLPEGTLAVVLEPERVAGMERELRQRFQRRGGYVEPGALMAAAARLPVALVSALAEPDDAALDLGIRSVEQASADDPRKVAGRIGELLAEGTACWIACPTTGDRDRFVELLREAELLAPGETEAEGVRPFVGPLRRGFMDPASGRALLTAHELLRRAYIRRPRAARRRRALRGAAIQSFVELKPGDIVVHLVHGIGRFLGVERLDGDAGVDHLVLEYQDQVKVYVPATKIELVQRYLGLKGHRPRLSKIGGTSWGKQKERARRAVMDLAADLLDVQAARSVERGTAYPEDGPWQAEFEAAFPFEDTVDQVAATEAIAEDMHSGRPMDRLICGDVGYGKTEIAMRAAFRAVIAKRQVAVLVPTTLLAEQHAQTFHDRMAEFPVRIACLNRLRSSQEARAILKALKAGEVDILIGTHRILSGDVVFRDLGLVVIDEEQRFGVAHKERLKHLRKTVDVLTLTATPIPRTLHMSLLGIKDIAALETPPEGRRAIQTVIAREDPALIREAMLRELSREGQVFFVHNRVKTIAKKTDELKRIVPEARFVFAHGQLDDEALEDRMLTFLRGDADVLVCTTIIESGLDIPRANTMFIDRADRFGLSELHQLRGRVGRYTHRAHAYMLIPRHGKVSEVGLRRLKAIEEFSQLGAGFKIAMRDLEIRGAGNLLGTAQSGFISMVGYDLYCRLLKQAIDALRAHGAVDKGAIDAELGIEVTRGLAYGRGPAVAQQHKALELALGESLEMELKLEARLERAYIEDEVQRLEMYRKLAACGDEPLLDDVTDELADRFGKPPKAARTLIDWTRLRIRAEGVHVIRIGQEGKMGTLSFAGNGKKLRARLEAAGADARWPEPGLCYVVVSQRPDPSPERVLAELLKALDPGARPRGGSAKGRSAGAGRPRTARTR